MRELPRPLTSEPPRDVGGLVAILKDEGPFIEEWLAYHRLIGVEHFYLYDNDPALPLRSQLTGHEDVTVIDWVGEFEHLPGRNKQTKAYTDALGRVRQRWMAVVDGDEFIVLRKHDTLQSFLSDFEDVSAVRLTWHVFGHNGHYDNPDDLITASLTRRRASPGNMTKAITKVAAVKSIGSAHKCLLRRGHLTVDANKRPYGPGLYPGKTDVAHVNHYMCRSFLNWMHKVDRGAVSFSRGAPPPDPGHRWRHDREACLREFVQLTRDFNEHVDEHMLRFRERIEAGLAAARGPTPSERVLEPPGVVP
jgi:hypothetical protein